jgi:mRNA interferase RelE/StbE
MAKELIFTERFKKNFKALTHDVQTRFEEKLALFLENPKHPSLNIHRYSGFHDVWEAYISKQYRFTFSVTKESIIFRNIGPHKIIDCGDV